MPVPCSGPNTLVYLKYAAHQLEMATGRVGDGEHTPRPRPRSLPRPPSPPRSPLRGKTSSPSPSPAGIWSPTGNFPRHMFCKKGKKVQDAIDVEDDAEWRNRSWGTSRAHRCQHILQLKMH